MITGCYINVDDEGVYTIGEFECEQSVLPGEIHRMVGGYMEVAPSADTVSIFVNEDGKNINLPPNNVATMFWLLFDIYGCIAAGDYLAGNVVILGPATRSGRTTSAIANTLELIRSILEGTETDATFV